MTKVDLTEFGGRAARFGISGLLSTGLAYVTFMIGLQFWPYWAANLFSWVISIFFSFAANRRFTFGIRGRQGSGRDFAVFMVGAVLQLGIATIGYRILIGSLHLRPTLAFVINLVLTTSFSFLFMNLVTFRRTTRRQGEL